MAKRDLDTPDLFDDNYVMVTSIKPETNLFVLPMLASALPEDKDIKFFEGKPDWWMEIKYDGHRLILVVERYATRVNVFAWSRQGNARVLPRHLMEVCRYLPDGTYDGELYIPGGTSTDVTALDKQNQLQLVLFDILRVGDVSCMDRDSRYRRQLLTVATSKLSADSVIQLAPVFEVSAIGLNQIWARGGEGAVIKHESTKYAAGKRSKQWIKFKKELAAEVTITGFLPGSLGDHSIIVGKDRHGIEVRAKARNDEWRATFAAGSAQFIGRRLVIAYQDKTRDGKYRHPMADHLL
jgi:ATP-dependent DNA ligase